MQSISPNQLILEGRSKRLYRSDADTCIVELKPTLDSFTFNRHEMVSGTDALRLDFYAWAARELEKAGVPTAFIERCGTVMYRAKLCRTNAFEVIVKNFAVGSTLRKYPGLFKEMEAFDPPVVKFDYRTDPEDQPIADDYVRAKGLDPVEIKRLAVAANDVLRRALAPLVLVDICFIFGYTVEGQLVLISEVSPDCMRLRSADGQPFDKDLFRENFSHDEIRARWTQLIQRLAAGS